MIRRTIKLQNDEVLEDFIYLPQFKEFHILIKRGLKQNGK